VLTTDFWGPVSNFGIPFAAVMDTQKSPELYVVSTPLHRPLTRCPELGSCDAPLDGLAWPWLFELI